MNNEQFNEISDLVSKKFDGKLEEINGVLLLISSARTMRNQEGERWMITHFNKHDKTFYWSDYDLTEQTARRLFHEKPNK